MPTSIRITFHENRANDPNILIFESTEEELDDMCSNIICDPNPSVGSSIENVFLEPQKIIQIRNVKYLIDNISITLYPDIKSDEIDIKVILKKSN
jgi:hypothetical protein